MARRILLLCLFLVAAATSAHAKSPIRGFVIDITSGEPLPVANVVVKGTTRGGSTNLDGYFVIPNLDPGDYTLHVSYLGYFSKEVPVTVTNKTMEPLTVEISPESVALEEVVYTVQEQDEEDIRQSARVSTVPVDAKTLRKMPSLGAEMDVLRALQAIPGVKASSDISSALYVRGGSSDMTLIQSDQSTVYNPAHLFGIFSTFNADAVKHLELMKGGFPAEYGGRAGSVLNVVTNDGNRRKTKGLASVSIISARGAIEGPLPNKRGSYAFSGRRTYLEPLMAILKSSNGDMDDLPDYFFYDGNGKFNFDLTSTTTLTIGGYLGLDELKAEFGPVDSRLDMKTYWGNQTMFSRLRQVLAENSFITFGFAYSRYRSGFEMYNEGSLLYKFKNRFRDMAFRSDYEFYGLTDHVIKTGVEARRYSVELINRNDDVDYVTIDSVSWNFSHYVQDTWRINPHWELMPGLRWYFHEMGNRVRFDPRLAIAYHHDERTRLKLAGGRYTQWLDVISSGDMLSSFDVWVPNDGSVEPMYADQIVFGIEHDPRPDLELTFETYYNDLNDLNKISDIIDRGQNMDDAFLSGEGYAYGFEWMIRQKAGRLTGWLGYSLSWTKRKYPGTYLNDGQPFFPKWDRRHDFVAVNTYRLSDRWDVSTSWRYNTGQGYSRALGVYSQHYALMDNEYFPDGNRTVLYGGHNNYRLPADHRLDITVTYNHKMFGKYDAKLNLSVFNVYSRRAIWFRNYDTGENPVEVSDVKLLPILPLIGYEVKF